MTRNEARAQIQRMLGHNVSPTVASHIDDTFIFVQDELESEATLPFFLRKVDDTLVTVAGENLISYPNDFIRLWHEDPISMVFESRNFPLKLGSAKYLRERYTDGTSPMGFTEIGGEFQLFPTPTAVYPLIITYYAKDRKLDGNVENGWLRNLPGLMIGRCGLLIATGLRDPEAQKLFGALAAAGTEKLNQQSTAQDESGGKRIIGGED